MIGSGAFGKVFLAEHNASGKVLLNFVLKFVPYCIWQVFAIKAVVKEAIIRGDDIDVTMCERRILALGTRHITLL